MNKKDLNNRLDVIDDAMECDKTEQKTKKGILWMKWVVLAVCLCLVIAIGIPAIQYSIVGQSHNSSFLEVVAEWNGKLYSVVNDPDSDAFDNYNLEENITRDLLGDVLGSQELVIQNDENGTVTDQFTLYRYAKAPVTRFDWYPRMIVEDSAGNFYHAIIGSCFDADTQTPEEVFGVYGLSSEEDIAVIKRVGYENKKITERDYINKFYQGLMTDDWGDNEFLQKNVYQNTGLDEQEVINTLYPKYADDAVSLIVELKNGLCLDVNFSSHNYVNVFNELYFRVEDSWLTLVSEFQ